MFIKRLTFLIGNAVEAVELYEIAPYVGKDKAELQKLVAAHSQFPFQEKPSADMDSYRLFTDGGGIRKESTAVRDNILTLG